jgi:hypothetical protein
VRLFLQIPLVCVAFLGVASLHVISVLCHERICAFVPSLSSLPGRTFAELCALRMSSADVYPHSLFSLSHCVLSYPHALQLVREELQVRIPTIAIVCVPIYVCNDFSSLRHHVPLSISSF